MPVTQRKQILGVILAGGTSRRFGSDKCAALLGGKSMIDRVIERARPQVDELVLNVNTETGTGPDIECLPDDGPGQGPLAGILMGLKAAEGRGYSHLASFACDTPFFPRDTVARLSETLYVSNADVAFVRCGPTVHRIFAVWAISSRSRLAAAFAVGARSMRSIEGWLVPAWADFLPEGGPDGDPFFNINTGAELERAENWLSQHSPNSRLQM